MALRASSTCELVRWESHEMAREEGGGVKASGSWTSWRLHCLGLRAGQHHMKKAGNSRVAFCVLMCPPPTSKFKRDQLIGCAHGQGARRLAKFDWMGSEL